MAFRALKVTRVGFHGLGALLLENPEIGLAVDLSHLRVGAKVARRHKDELGTVIEMTGYLKVKWDDGKTSYYRPRSGYNIRLRPPPAKR
jgi:hypothetical protein